MKKVIAAAAGLMLVGAMVSSASAAVTFSGDARVRANYQTDYDFGREADGVRTNEIEQAWSSRVRLVIRAESKGGAYARARIRMAEASWDGTSGTRDKGGSTNNYVDYGYIGVPMGTNFLFQGGLMPANLTKFTYWDRRADQAVLQWSNDMTTLALWYQKTEEFTDPATDFVDDNDVDTWYGIWKQKFGGDMGITAVAGYQNNEKPGEDEDSGWVGTINFTGPAGPIALEAELAGVSEEIGNGEDTGVGGYLQGGMNFGATSVTLNGGFTSDGYKADDDFGFIMLGGASAITPSFLATIGEYDGESADTWWLYGIAGFKASEAMSLRGIVGWADMTNVGQSFEISGSLTYQISDGANFDWQIGYLALNAEDDTFLTEDPFGTAITFNVSF